MQDQLIGTTMPVLSVSLDPGESVVAEVGEFLDDRFDPDVHRPGRGVGGQGLIGALKRKIGGSSLLISNYSVQGATGTIAFAAKLPGRIRPVNVTGGRSPWWTGEGPGRHPGHPDQRRPSSSPSPRASSRARVSCCSASGARAGLDRARGEVIHYELAAGQSLRVHPGHVGMFDASVAFQVMRVQGVANRYFGGDTHHFAVLSGPGTVWLQSMPLPVLAASLVPYLPTQDNRSAAVEGGVIGGVINDLLR